MDIHFNLSSCDRQLGLPYNDDDKTARSKNERRIPDATFGLCTYDLGQRQWTQEWLDHDMIKLFGKVALKETLNHFKDLREPYAPSGNQVETYAYPMFAFGLWEAKRAAAKQNHLDTFFQSSRQLKTLLAWQGRIFAESDFWECSPIVWFFSSVGAEWGVYGCTEEQHRNGEGSKYVRRVLSSDFWFNE